MSQFSGLHHDFTMFGTKNGGGSDVSAEFNARVVELIGSAPNDINTQRVVIDLGSMHYRFDSSINIDQRYVTILGVGAKVDCGGSAEYGFDFGYGNSAQNMLYNRVIGVTVEGATKAGIRARANHYMELQDVDTNGNQNGIIIEGCVSTTLINARADLNEEWGIVEKGFFKTFDGDGGNPPEVRCGAGSIIRCSTRGNKVGGFRISQSSTPRLISPQFEANSPAQDGIGGIGILIEQSLAAHILSPYSERHETCILINNNSPADGISPQANLGHHTIAGGSLSGPQVNNVTPISVRIEGVRGVKIGGRIKANVEIDSASDQTVFLPEMSLGGSATIIDNSPDLLDLRSPRKELAQIKSISKGVNVGSNFTGFVDFAAGETLKTVTFATPEPDANYVVHINMARLSGARAAIAGLTAVFSTWSATGFSIEINPAVPTGSSVRAVWTLIRLN